MKVKSTQMRRLREKTSSAESAVSYTHLLRYIHKGVVIEQVNGPQCFARNTCFVGNGADDVFGTDFVFLAGADEDVYKRQY